MTDYKLIFGGNKTVLEELVKKELKDGYSLLGGPFATTESNNNDLTAPEITTFYQAVIKEVEDILEPVKTMEEVEEIIRNETEGMNFIK